MAIVLSMKKQEEANTLQDFIYSNLSADKLVFFCLLRSDDHFWWLR